MRDKDSLWDFWFVTSLLLEVSVIITGSLERSIDLFPNWDVFAWLFTINLICCVFVGLKLMKYEGS